MGDKRRHEDKVDISDKISHKLAPEKSKIFSLLYQREYKAQYSPTSAFRDKLYPNIRKVTGWTPDSAHHGGIFNFDFSTDGALLGAACEGCSVLLLDPLNGSLVASREQAHTDCVNCIKFLDTRTFVTCSDDTTVCLWDVRNLKHKVRTLSGHSSWVKNIEYARTEGLLVTSGFDGNIYTWDINRESEARDNIADKVYHDSNLMRAKLSPDSSKLVISTKTGYLLVIHDLDLASLSRDVAGFEPSLYSWVASSSPLLPSPAYPKLAWRHRNRVEVIVDFPPADNAMMIASLEVHPRGWCVASRNTANRNQNTEWTCIHDIHSPGPRQSHDRTSQVKRTMETTTSDQPNPSPSSSLCPPTPKKRRKNSSQGNPIDQERSQLRTSVSPNCPSCSSVVIALSEVLVEENDPQEGASVPRQSTDESTTTHPPSPDNSKQLTYSLTQSPRLTHFIEEPNVGRGFIKELSFSSDGCILASPFSYGLRLLAFDKYCREVCDVLYERPDQAAVECYEVNSCMSHTREVTTVKFSPTHCLVVSGCLSGEINFHQPVF